MIDWLQSGDDTVFRFVNHTLNNRVFDTLMPLASNTPGFVPGVVLVLVLLIWKGGVRGRGHQQCEQQKLKKADSKMTVVVHVGL